MIPTAWQLFLATAEEHKSYFLAWFTAKDRDTLLPQTLGLWTGDDHQVITIGGVSRTYYGAQSLLRMPGGITYRSGLDIQMQRLEIGPTPPEVALLLRGYDVRQAPVEIHVKLDDVDGNQIGDPWRAWHGRVDSLSISTDGGWGEVNTVASLELAPSSRDGTRTLGGTRSAATYKMNNSDDFGKYSAAAPVVRTPWGTRQV